MGSANKLHALSKPMKRESLPPPPPPSSVYPGNPSNTNNANPNPSSSPFHTPSVTIPTSSSVSVVGAEEDAALQEAEFLTREEVLRRRSRRLRHLARCYRDQYWALMEEVRVKHGEYYWRYGKSPFEEEEGGGGEENGVGAANAEAAEGSGENGRLGLGLGLGEMDICRKCAFSGCKSKAMALTRFCHPHILSDNQQTLYKACSYVIKSGQTGQIICGKPVLRAAMPSLCPMHFQRAQKHVSQALKKAGLNTCPSSRPAPKFHSIIAEYVHQIQAKRRKTLNATDENTVNKDETVS